MNNKCLRIGESVRIPLAGPDSFLPLKSRPPDVDAHGIVRLRLSMATEASSVPGTAAHPLDDDSAVMVPFHRLLQESRDAGAKVDAVCAVCAGPLMKAGSQVLRFVQAPSDGWGEVLGHLSCHGSLEERWTSSPSVSVRQ